MGLHTCQNCHTRVSRAQLCSRCGSPQPRRVFRGVLATMGLAAFAAMLGLALHLLELAPPELRPPTPSGGTWASQRTVAPKT